MGMRFEEENRDQTQESHLGGFPLVLARTEGFNQENCQKIKKSKPIWPSIM